MTEPFDPNVYNGGEELRKALADEAAATREYLKFKRKADEWEVYRNKLRAQIREATGNATTIKIAGVLVLTDTFKDQFAGARFAAEHPSLAEEFTVPRTVMEIDVEALRARHPDIATKFTTRAFTNKLS